MATKARQQYFADEDSLQKIRREFSIADEIQQKIDSIEPWAQVNKIETVKVNWTALVPDANKAVNVEVPEVIDNLYTVDSDNALSAKQWKLLYDYIQNIASRWRFLSNWNSATGLPMTNPSESPYPYKSWDYFAVSNVATSWGTNYRPDGSSYTIWQASTVVETDSVDVSDFYFYDGTNWLLLKNSGRSWAVDSSLSTTSTNPVENRVITNALNWKQETLIAWNNIQIAADWKTISATDTTYSAWANISIDANNEISAVDTTYTAWTNVQISNQNVISATDTKYTAWTWINIDANNVISSTVTSAQWWNITWTLSNQTDLQSALDSKVNLWINKVFDSTVVEIWKWEQWQWWASSWHHITLDPNWEVSTYNVTTGGHNEATLWSGTLELLNNTVLGWNKTATFDHEKIVADDWTDTETYNFFGNNRIARLSDVWTGYTAWDWINIDANNEISNTLPWPTIAATAPTGTEWALWYDTTNDVLMAYNWTAWKEAWTQMKVLSYGHSTWQDFIDAYNENAIVYCRASSSSDPSTGSQWRLAFMAYVNNASNPTEVEFQYYRSRSDHNSAANQLDEVYVYKLVPASGWTWTVTQRNTWAKAVAWTWINLAFGSGNMTISADTTTLATKTDLSSKQDTLVSWTNIKSINNNSLLGSWNLTLNDVKVSAAAPSSPTEWMAWYDSTNDVLKTYDWSNWNECWAWWGWVEVFDITQYGIGWDWTDIITSCVNNNTLTILLDVWEDDDVTQTWLVKWLVTEYDDWATSWTWRISAMALFNLNWVGSAVPYPEQ